MKKLFTIPQLLFFGSVFGGLIVLLIYQEDTQKELEDVKRKLFKSTNDISKLPIYADPPTLDYISVKYGVFLFQIDSMEIKKIKKYRNELEPFILQRIDSGYAWVYLAAHLQYESAVPLIKDRLFRCDKFYGWEVTDSTETERYIMDDAQYCYQMAYISAIEYITSKPIQDAITITKQEYSELKTKAKQCVVNPIDSLNVHCVARWILEKLK